MKAARYQHRRKSGYNRIVAAGMAVCCILLVGIGGAWSWGLYTSRQAAAVAGKVEADDARAVSAAHDALMNCDAQASHPSDPHRFGAPVPDERLALGAAIAACEAAVALNHDSARANFELGRSYWIAHRDTEAFSAFAASDATGGYAAAQKYIGDAFFFGRGLPKDFGDKNAQTALVWYRKALDGGFLDAQIAISIAEDAIRKNVFDRTQFQYPDNMEALYTGNFAEVQAPLALAYYTQGLVKRLNDENTVFMDQKCKALLNMVGNTVIEYSELIAIAKQFSEAGKSSSEENRRRLVRGMADMLLADIYKDYGDRDATVLFDKDVYGCDSPVTKKIIENIMVRVNTSRGH